MEQVIVSISVISAIAALLAVVARCIKQPPIIAYLLAGVLVGPLGLNLIGSGTDAGNFVQLFAHIGVVFLLFIVGIHLDIRVFKELGKVAVFAGCAEIIVTSIIGFLLALFFGFSSLIALYIGAALAFSSTVVVVKILSDKKEIDTLHGKIALGILIIEDIVAAIALMALPLVKNGASSWSILQQLGIVCLLALFIFIATAIINKKILNFLAKSQEALFLFGISWALVLATVFDTLGFSLEIGALIAGMSLASSTYAYEFSIKMKPLRDFFMVLFFVFFGSQLATTVTPYTLLIASILSLFVIIGKPLLVMSIVGFFGYTKRTNFLASSSLAQISEFSLILILLGYTLGHIPRDVMSLIVLVAIITIGLSSYSIYYAHTLFKHMQPLLHIFERKKVKEEKKVEEKKYDVILFGSHRIGHKMLQTLRDMKYSILVVDHNPHAVLSLQAKKIETLFGDAAEPEFLAELPLAQAKLIISTISDEQANLAIQEYLTKNAIRAPFIATAEQPYVALELYKKGVQYVIIPHHLGGDLMSSIIKAFKMDEAKYKKLGKDHFLQLLKGKENSTYTF